MLTAKDIKEFRVIYERTYGTQINDAEASRLAQQLINLYKAVYSKDAVHSQ